jgi:hypothetical protein
LLRAWAPPFDPGVVSGEIADVLKGYGVLNVTGDDYAGEWPVASFRNHGIAYERCEKNKSELYLAFVPVTNSAGVELPDDKRLFNELRRLERKRGRAGKDTVDHPPRLHDDLANAVAGLSYLLINDADSQNNNGFNATKHISQDLRPGHGTVYVGLTLSNPAASVIGQVTRMGGIEIYAAFASNGGLEHHIKNHLKPWLMQHGLLNEEWIMGCYEDLEPLQARYALVDAVTQILPGDWQQPSTPWEARYQTMLTILAQATPFSFAPKLQIDASASLLTAALARQLDPKEKTVYSAVGNALSLLLSRLADMPKGPAGTLREDPDWNPATDWMKGN